MSKFLKVIVNLFLVFAILVAGAILVPPVLGISTTMIDSASMDTNLPVGSITYSQDVSVTELSSGDKILVEADNSVNVYVIETADAVNGVFTVSGGDGHETESQEITLRNEALKVVLTVPFIGYLMVAMHSVEGLIIIGLVVLFVIILFILSELWKKSDDDEDEDDEDEYAEDEDDVEVDADEAEAVSLEAAFAETETEDESKAAEVNPESLDLEDKEEPEAVSEELMMELSSAELAQAIAETMESAEITEAPEAFVEEVEAAEEVEEAEEAEEIVEDDSNTFVKVSKPTLDEILAKAESAGDKPEIVSYDTFGVTIVDYSNCI